MEPITDFEFNYDEQYENEKGIFTVLSMNKNEMVIQWEDGEKIETEIDFQRRIQVRRRQEKIAREAKANEAKGQPGKSASRKRNPEFEGLQPGDFKKSAAGTKWRSRKQLGGAVTRQLSKDTFVFNSWALARNPEIQWADVEHRKREGAVNHAFFFSRLDDLSLIYGCYVTLPDAESESTKNRETFAAWLAKKENDRMIQEIATKGEMEVYNIEKSSLAVLLPFEDGWQTADEDEPQKVDMLVTYISSLPGKDSSIAIGKKIPKDEAVARGKEIAADIAQLFSQLMPLYKVSAAG